MTHAANLVLAGFGLLGVSVVPEPQAYAVLILLVLQAGSAFGLKAV